LSRVDEVLKGPIKSKTIFPALILHLVKQEPDHGYGLMQRIDTICGGLIAVNTNKIYPLLRRLEERGFLKGSWESPDKRARRIYEITADGELRLARIKDAMLPYLNAISKAIDDLRGELF
jgi:DNA-binding PadR family transcriptional regulator